MRVGLRNGGFKLHARRAFARLHAHALASSMLKLDDRRFTLFCPASGRLFCSYFFRAGGHLCHPVPPCATELGSKMVATLLPLFQAATRNHESDKSDPALP